MGPSAENRKSAKLRTAVDVRKGGTPAVKSAQGETLHRVPVKPCLAAPHQGAQEVLPWGGRGPPPPVSSAQPVQLIVIFIIRKQGGGRGPAFHALKSTHTHPRPKVRLQLLRAELGPIPCTEESEALGQDRGWDFPPTGICSPPEGAKAPSKGRGVQRGARHSPQKLRALPAPQSAAERRCLC